MGCTQVKQGDTVPNKPAATTPLSTLTTTITSVAAPPHVPKVDPPETAVSAPTPTLPTSNVAAPEVGALVIDAPEMLSRQSNQTKAEAPEREHQAEEEAPRTVVPAPAPITPTELTKTKMHADNVHTHRLFSVPLVVVEAPAEPVEPSREPARKKLFKEDPDADAEAKPRPSSPSPPSPPASPASLTRRPAPVSPLGASLLAELGRQKSVKEAAAEVLRLRLAEQV